MGRSNVTPIRESTKMLFHNNKWIILIRDSEEEEWRAFKHHLSNRIMRYRDLDKAIYAMKHIQCTRYRAGHAKLSKLEEFERASKV